MARRGKGIYKRKDGRFEGRHLMPDGKYKSVYGHSYNEAKAKLDDCIAQRSPPKEKIIHKAGQSVLWSAICEEWLDQKKTLLEAILFGSVRLYHA